VPDPLLKHLNQPPPAILYHYTSMNVLEKITDTGELWASEARFLNDSTEYEHARAYIRGMLEDRVKKSALLYRIKEDLPIIDRRSDEYDVFITSFSSEGDSLPQWRGYCSDGHGVAIGFNPDALTGGDVEIGKSFRPVPDDEPAIEWSLLKCVYTDREKKKLIGDNIDGYLEVVKGKHPTLSPNRGATFLLSTIQMCRPLFKNASFKEEQEWRLVVNCYYDHEPKRHFRIWGSTAVPFIKIDVRKKYKHDFIKEVVIGPCSNEDLAVRGVDRLLAGRGLGKGKVRKSNIPYRTW
jgi:hypothetical protein